MPPSGHSGSSAHQVGGEELVVLREFCPEEVGLHPADRRLAGADGDHELLRLAHLVGVAGEVSDQLKLLGRWHDLQEGQ